jgi:nitrogen regulatory protein P-II 1
MTKLECIIRPNKLEAVLNAVAKIGNYGVTVSQVMGCGLQKGWKEEIQEFESIINLLPKVKLEMVVKDEQVKEVVQLISQTARTGEIGDGKVFVYPLSDAVRIRTGETGEKAII